jgi:hypothetical protein
MIMYFNSNFSPIITTGLQERDGSNGTEKDRGPQRPILAHSFGGKRHYGLYDSLISQPRAMDGPNKSKLTTTDLSHDFQFSNF